MHQIEVRALCEPCNTKWGAQLEQDVRPVFELMCRRQPGTLSVKGAEILATWAMKVTILREYMNPRHMRYISPSAARLLYENRLPPDKGVAIWAATSDEPIGGRWWVRSRLGYLAARPAMAEGVPQVYVSFMTFAHLALFVIGTGTEHELRPMDRELPDSFIRLWPNPTDAPWPLPVTLTGRELDVLYGSAYRFLGDLPGGGPGDQA